MVDEDHLRPVEHYLRHVTTRDNDGIEEIREELKRLKKSAILDGDQLQAKLIWCYEEILEIQRRYSLAFENMKTGFFYDAWCELERIEVAFHFLERHYDLEGDTKDIYKLQFIRNHSRQFQLLYPYALFFSTALIILGQRCSICEKAISIHHPCGHHVGEIYEGELCLREITEVNVLSVDIVANPVHKSAVPFLIDPESGKTYDHYNYVNVFSVVSNLENPFDMWELRQTTKLYPHSDFESIGRNEHCPCGSGKKYQECCLKKPGVEKPHFHITLPASNRGIFLNKGEFVTGKLSHVPD